MDRLVLSIATLKAYFKRRHQIERTAHIAYMIGVDRRVVDNWERRGDTVPELAARAIVDMYPDMVPKRRRPAKKAGGRRNG